MAKPRFKRSTEHMSATNAAFAAAQAAQRKRGRSTEAPAQLLKRLIGPQIQRPVDINTYRFWLVQRLEPNSRTGKGWFGNKFKLDYMGYAEFEFGRPNESLRRMHSLGSFEIQAVHLTRKGVTRTVFCVAPAADLSTKLTDFVRWASQDYPRAKEFTKFDTVFDQNNSFGQLEYCRTIAWWSLDDDIMWTLDLEVAEQLLYGLQNPATA